MAERTERLPRASVTPDALKLLKLAAARRGGRVAETDIIREALKAHPDIIKEAQRENVDLSVFDDVNRGGYRMGDELEKDSSRKQA